MFYTCTSKFALLAADIDFLSHYRLVDPQKIDSYARAFVVEDSDLDTVINQHVRQTYLVLKICMEK